MRLERRLGYETEGLRLHALSKLLWFGLECVLQKKDKKIQGNKLFCINLILQV